MTTTLKKPDGTPYVIQDNQVNYGTLDTPDVRTVAPVEPTAGDIVAGSTKQFSAPTYTGDAYDTAAADADLTYQQAGSTPIDEAAIRKAILGQFQGEIDATNSIYNNKLKDATVTNANRLGSNAAVQARRGLAGSTFGARDTDVINEQNADDIQSVNDQRTAALAAIMGKATTLTASEIAAKQKAKNEGVDAHLNYLKSSGERKATAAQTAAQAILDQGFKIEDLSPDEVAQLSKQYGVSVADIVASYAPLKTKKDQATAEQLAKQQKAELDTQFSLSEGQARYDKNGKLIASRGKTFAPKSGGTGGGAGVTGAVSSDLDFLYNTVRTGKNSATVGLLDSAWKSARNDRDKINLLAQNVALPSALKSDLIQRNAALPSIDSAISLLNNGVKTGYFKNLGEGVANKFGQTTDPEISKIKQYLTAAIQPYRSSVTGAAWGDQEEAEYQALFGSTLDNPEFLKSKLENLKKLMVQQNIATISSGLSLSDPTLASQYLGGSTTTTAPSGGGSKFDYLTPKIKVEGTKAYLPRSEWSKLNGSDMEALLAEAASDGYQLLISE